MVELVLIAGAAAGMMRLAFWYFSYDRILRRKMSAHAPRPIGSASGGLMRVTGRVRPVGEQLIAPGSGRRCLAFSVLVFEQKEEGDRKTLARLHAGAPFWIEDDSGSARVEARQHINVAVDRSDLRVGRIEDSVKLCEMIRELGIDDTNFLGMDRNLTFQEAVIAEGDLASVLGFATVELDLTSSPPGPRQLPMQPILRDRGDQKPVLAVTGSMATDT